jgi:hypothetical protein
MVLVSVAGIASLRRFSSCYTQGMRKLLIGLLGFVAFGCTSLAQSPQPETVRYTRIVKQLNLVGLTGTSVPPTLLFMPGETGLYRISEYAVTTVGDPNSGNAKDVLHWFDGAEEQYTPVSPVMICLADVGCFGSASTVIYVQASHPVNYELQLALPTVGTYNWFYTVERLF